MDTTAPARAPTIDAAIDQALADARIVGAVVLVARDGSIVYRRAAGLADRERNVPMREDAVFRLASLTKPLVTAAALRLAELGRIALDDPVTRYLPDFRPALPDGETPTDHAAPPAHPHGGPFVRLHAAAGRALSPRAACPTASTCPGSPWRTNSTA